MMIGLAPALLPITRVAELMRLALSTRASGCRHWVATKVKRAKEIHHHIFDIIALLTVMGHLVFGSTVFSKQENGVTI